MSATLNSQTSEIIGTINSLTSADEGYMLLALEEAAEAAALGEVPVGAVIVREGEIMARAGNRRELTQDVCSHAELIALRAAERRLGTWRLDDCDLYVTLEPCHMCAAACVQARLRRIYYAVADPKSGAIVSTDSFLTQRAAFHSVDWQGGLLAEPAAQMLRDFFLGLRQRNRQDNTSCGGRGARIAARKTAAHPSDKATSKSILND